jgi:hypothetical protein
LWELDLDEYGDAKSEDQNDDRQPHSGEEEEYVDDREQIADSIIMGVSDY